MLRVILYVFARYKTINQLYLSDIVKLNEILKAKGIKLDFNLSYINDFRYSLDGILLVYEDKDGYIIKPALGLTQDNLDYFYDVLHLEEFDNILNDTNIDEIFIKNTKILSE